MFDTTLFLGMSLDGELEAALNRLNPHLRALLVQEGSEYLHEATYQGQQYLGKHLGKLQELEQLSLVELNVRSLIKKVAPNYPSDSQEIFVFALPIQS